jgi:hypothetical protein
MENTKEKKTLRLGGRPKGNRGRYDTTIKTTREQKNRLKSIKDHHGLKDNYDAIDFLLESEDVRNFQKLQDKIKELKIELNEKEKLLAEYRDDGRTLLNAYNVLKLEVLKLREQVKGMEKVKVECENALKEAAQLRQDMGEMSSTDTTKVFEEKVELKKKIVDLEKTLDVWRERVNASINLRVENGRLQRLLNECVEFLIKRKKSKMKKQ